MKNAQMMFGVFFGALAMMVLPILSSLSGWKVDYNLDASISWAIVCAGLSISAAVWIFFAQQNETLRAKRLSGLSKLKLIAFQLNSIKTSVDDIIGVKSADDWRYMIDVFCKKENYSAEEIKEMIGVDVFSFRNLDRIASCKAIELPSEELSSLMMQQSSDSFEFAIFFYARYADYLRYLKELREAIDELASSIGYSKLQIFSGLKICNEKNPEVYKSVDEAVTLLAPALGSAIRGIYENYELFDAMLGIIADEDGIISEIREAMIRNVTKSYD